MKNGNLLVVYRMCGIPSTNPSPIFQEDKFKLNQLCLRSFREAFREVAPRMIFLNDFCDTRYIDMIKNINPFRFQVTPSEIGINATMLRAYEIANDQDYDILFAECDYLWRPNTGKILIEGMKQLGLVVPYDNLNFYLDPSIHSDNVKLKLINGHHWRSVERTTMTFAITNKIFKENYETFRTYGYLDNDVWHTLRAAGHQMWNPIPSLSTHMVRDFMAPGIDWKTEFEKYL